MTINLLEKTRVNIKDLSLPESTKRVLPPLFDTKKDISDREWIWLTHGFNFTNEGGWKQSLPHYFYLKFVAPERFSKLAIGEQQWKWTKEVVEGSQAKEIITNFAFATVFFPEKRDDLNLNSLTEKLMIAYLSGLRDDQRWDDFHKQSLYFSTLFPNSVSKLGLDEESWQGIKDCYRKQMDQVRTFPHRLANAADILALTKIIYPQRFDEVKPNTSFLRDLRELLEQDRQQSNWGESGFTNIAFDLTILGAKEIKFTDQGMEIIGRDKPQSLSPESTPDLPQRRKF